MMSHLLKEIAMAYHFLLVLYDLSPFLVLARFSLKIRKTQRCTRERIPNRFALHSRLQRGCMLKIATKNQTTRCLLRAQVCY